jgi:hypothetical protein
MHKIKEKLMDELYEIEDKMKKASGGKVSAGDLEYIHKLTDTIKNIDKIEMLEGDEGYSEESNWMADGRMYGTSYDDGMSYARGRGRNAKRDSMGRYSRDMMHHDDMSYERGASYARGGRGGRRGDYSRTDAKEEMIERLEGMMHEAETPKEREAIKRCIMQIEND